MVLSSCATVSEPSVEKFSWPSKEEARFGKPDGKRPYKVLGVVRSKVNFPTLTSAYDEKYLCQNYFRKAVRDLVRMAKEKGADAVIEVKSVTFLMDGTMETYEEAQCADDGAEGQILAKGTAIRWVTPEEAAEEEGRAKPSGRFLPTTSRPGVPGRVSAAGSIGSSDKAPALETGPETEGAFGAE